MTAKHPLFVCLVLACCATAQDANLSQLRQAGLRLLAQAQVAASSASSRFRDNVLDEVSVAEFEAGEKQASAVTLKQALAAFHQRFQERRDIAHGQIPGQAWSGPADSGHMAALYAQRHLEAHDSTGAREWLAAALEVFPLVSDDRERAFVGLWMYKVQLAIGDIEGARRTVAAVDPPSRPNPSPLGDIAAQLVRTGDLGGAIAMANGQSEIAASQILKKVAIAQAEGKDFSGALQTVQKIHSPYERVDALAAIGEEESKAGDKQSAMATFATAIQFHPKGSTVSRAFVDAEARSGFFENAMQLLASSDRHDGLSPYGYLDVGVIAAAAQRNDIAKKCFEAATALIQDAPEPLTASNGQRMDLKQMQLQEVVSAEAQAGEFDDATKTAELISGPYKEIALASIAQRRADAGKGSSKEFLATFNFVRPAGGFALEKVFRSYCKGEVMNTCLEAASDLTFPDRRAGALLGMAESLLGINPISMPGSSSSMEYTVPPR